MEYEKRQAKIKDADESASFIFTLFTLFTFFKRDMISFVELVYTLTCNSQIVLNIQ